MINSETIASIATGLTNSGIGIIRMSGDDSIEIIKKIFKKKSGNDFNEFESHKAYYGFIFDNNNPIDEVLVLILKGPKSFTTEDTVEINCHGGLFVMNKILDLCIKNGARLAEKGEFTKRAFLGGRIDLSEAEAVIDIINAESDLSASNSINQLRGKLFEKINYIREIILNETAFIEAALDDPEHYSLDDYPENLRVKINNLCSEIAVLTNSFSDGKIIKEGINTVILGKPNVGKSSILNVLAKKDVAIVTDIAGTTRDALTENITIGGIKLNISDTAGIRNTDDVVEKIGVDRAYKYADEADLIIMVVDSSRNIDEEDKEVFEYIKDKKAVILLNKSDLKSLTDEAEINKYSDKEIINVSALNETGIDSLKKYIQSEFLSGELDYNNNIIITNQRHRNLLSESFDSLKNVIESIDNNMPEDFFSIDLSNAYDCLGRIIGESVEDDIVNKVFSKFCMGK